MTTIWNYRGDDRALWAVIAAIVGSYVLAMRLARWDATWQWVPLALPVAVLLIWFFLAKAGVRDLGFPAAGVRTSAAAGPLGGAGRGPPLPPPVREPAPAPPTPATSTAYHR